MLTISFCISFSFSLFLFDLFIFHLIPDTPIQINFPADGISQCFQIPSFRDLYILPAVHPLSPLFSCVTSVTYVSALLSLQLINHSIHAIPDVFASNSSNIKFNSSMRFNSTTFRFITNKFRIPKRFRATTYVAWWSRHSVTFHLRYISWQTKPALQAQGLQALHCEKFYKKNLH